MDQPSIIYNVFCPGGLYFCAEELKYIFLEKCQIYIVLIFRSTERSIGLSCAGAANVLDVLMFETHPMTYPLSKPPTLSNVGNMNLKLIVVVKLVNCCSH